MRRFPFSACATLLLLSGRALAECPACAIADGPRSVWPIVGAFMLVPPLLAVTVILLMRREFRSSFGSGTRAPGEIVSFTRRRKARTA